MINLGIGAAQQLQLIALLHRSHTIYITVRMLNTDHTYLDDFSKMFIDGQVTYDADATDADRALDITLLDPLRSIQLDPDSPSPTAVFVTNMISIIYNVSDPFSGMYFSIPVFCGPIDDIERNGVFLNIKCLGKETLCSDSMWTGRTFKKKTPKTDIIKALLTDAGETKMDIPDKPDRTLEPLSVDRDNTTWGTAKNLSNSMADQLFYDGRGVAVNRDLPVNPSFTFSGAWLKSQPKFGYDLKEVSNAVLFTGGAPKGSRTAIQVKSIAPEGHPLNPYRVGRNGKPRYINPIRVTDKHVRRKADAQKRSDALLADALLASTEVSYDILPGGAVLLEPKDVLFLNYDGYALEHRVRKHTLPLRNSGTGSINILRRSVLVGKKPLMPHSAPPPAPKPKRKKRRRR